MDKRKKAQKSNASKLEFMNMQLAQRDREIVFHFNAVQSFLYKLLPQLLTDKDGNEINIYQMYYDEENAKLEAAKLDTARNEAITAIRDTAGIELTPLEAGKPDDNV